MTTMITPTLAPTDAAGLAERLRTLPPQQRVRAGNPLYRELAAAIDDDRIS